MSGDGKLLAANFGRKPFSIYVAHLSGTGAKLGQPVRLTNDSWNNWPSSWSLDSRGVFFTSSRRQQSIYECRIASDSCQLLLAGPGNYSMWVPSPDRKWFLVLLDRGVPGKRRLLRVPAVGGSPETVLAPDGTAEVHCATTGSASCVLSEETGKQESFFFVDPVRGRLEEITRIDTENGNMNWSLSPDGSKIALIENLSDWVRVLALHSKQVKMIRPTPPQMGLQCASWSADSQRLFLSAFPNGIGRLLEMDADGQTHLLLENSNGWIGYPAASPDGKNIAYINATLESNVVLLEHF